MTATSTGTLLSVGISSSSVCGVRDYALMLGAELRQRGFTVDEEWGYLDASSTGSTVANWLSSIGLAIAQRPPDVLLLHYSVFSYSWKGIPLVSLRVIARLRRLNIPVVTVLHEFVYPWGHRGIRGLVHATTQRAALRPLVCASSQLVVTTPDRVAWLGRRAWLPPRPTKFVPVFSNIPCTSLLPPAIPPNVVIFGYIRDADRCDIVATAVAKSAEVVPGLGILLVGGPGMHHAGSQRWIAAAHRAGCRLSFTGIVEPRLLSAALASASVAVFLDSSGPTSRKGTLGALLAHGCPTIAFDGDQIWRELVDAGAVVTIPPCRHHLECAIVGLLQDDESRLSLSGRARLFYQSRMDVARAAEALSPTIATAAARGGKSRMCRPGP